MMGSGVAPPLPVDPRTLFGLLLLREERSVDLRSATRLLLDDPGAVLQVFRLSAAEFSHPEQRPVRMEQCLAVVSIGELAECLRAQTEACDDPPPEDFWQIVRHSREIGLQTQLLAEAAGLSPEEGYLLGLLHELPALDSAHGSAPSLHGTRSLRSDPRYSCLPPSLTANLSAIFAADPQSPWPEVLEAAHLSIRDFSPSPARQSPFGERRLSLPQPPAAPISWSS